MSTKIYVEFYKNNPVVIVENIDDGEDVREFNSLDSFLNLYPDFRISVDSIDLTPQLKRLAIRKIESRANYYQSLVVGTPDSARELRFQYNIKASKAILDNTASTSQTEMLQNQLDSNIYAEHYVIKDMTLTEFAQWIVDFEQLLYKGAGLIEKTLIYGKALINNAETKAEIDQVLIDLEASALTEFNALMSQTSSVLARKST